MISYRSEGNGPLLVYLPGLDGTGKLLFKQIPALVSTYRVITFPYPGGRGVTYDDLADEVAAVIASIGATGLLLGESFGGTVALWTALNYPELVDRLVVVNSFPRFRRRLLIRFGLAMARLAPGSLINAIRRLGISIGAAQDGIPPEDRARLWAAVGDLNLIDYTRRLELIKSIDITERLCEIKTPTLFIAAERDLLVPSVRDAALMAARIPNAAVRLVPRAGHACLMTDKVSVSSLISAWLETSGTPG